MLLWELLHNKQPFTGRPAVTAFLECCNGKRPPIELPPETHRRNEYAPLSGGATQPNAELCQLVGALYPADVKLWAHHCADRPRVVQKDGTAVGTSHCTPPCTSLPVSHSYNAMPGTSKQHRARRR